MRLPPDFAKAAKGLRWHLLKRLDERIVALERRRQREVIDERKKDTREKIALGGLIVKAGLRAADRAFLLGVLLEAATVRVSSPEHHRLTAKGATAFRNDRLRAAEAANARPATVAVSSKSD
jgi:hypothetical protein